MRPLLSWLVLAVAAFAALAGGYHWYLGEHPRTVVIVVDSSFPMRADWERLPALFARLADDPYARYRVVTDKGQVAEYAGAPRPPSAAPYAPRALQRLAEPGFAAHLAGADAVYLVTNAPAAEVPVLPGARLLRP
ncbi:MAG TPA: hypothetical protein VIX81_06665 [Gammaproteobacteria bacterium]